MISGDSRCGGRPSDRTWGGGGLATRGWGTFTPGCVPISDSPKTVPAGSPHRVHWKVTRGSRADRPDSCGQTATQTGRANLNAALTRGSLHSDGPSRPRTRTAAPPASSGWARSPARRRMRQVPTGGTQAGPARHDLAGPTHPAVHWLPRWGCLRTARPPAPRGLGLRELCSAG